MPEETSRIRNNIKMNYRKKLITSLVCLVFLLVFWLFSSFHEFFYPVQVPKDHLGSRLNSSSEYAVFEEISLHYTGYCYEQKGKATGYYYYGFLDDACLFFLLKNTTCNDGQESLTLKNVRGAVAMDSPAQELLLNNLATDLNWSSEELTKITEPFIIVEAQYHYIAGFFSYGILALLTIIALLTAVLYIIYIIDPALSPACGTIFRPSISRNNLLHAEEDLEEHCLVRGENFYITKDFLIELTRNTTHIFKLKDLAWVYDHNGFAPFLGHRQKVRYTITYYDKRKHAVHSAYEKHADVDTILSYLRDYYPEILNGYTPQNQELFKEL